MKVKDSVLNILKKDSTKYYSGAEIAKILCVSRNAVWKAVKSLEAEGYLIEGINNKGYRLLGDADIITLEGINNYIDDKIKSKLNIKVYKTITSTNTILKEFANQSEAEWTILVAEEQSNGRGRMNRVFYSPSSTGIYMSVLLRPDFDAKESMFITTMTAVAVARAIDKICNVESSIKWVNDIYINNKKVCGILTEASMNVELNKLDYAIVGIGINVTKPKENFPEELKDIAGAIFDDSNVFDNNIRNKLVAEIITNIYNFYNTFTKHEFIECYRKKSFLIGKEVYILSDLEKTPLKVIDVDENAALVVKTKDGIVKKLSSGEVSVRICEK